MADSINLPRAASELALQKNHDHPPSRMVIAGDQVRKEDAALDLERIVRVHTSRSSRSTRTPINLDEAIKLMRAALVLFPTGQADCIDSLKNNSLRPMYTLIGVFWVEARRYHHLRVATSTLKSAKRSQPSWGIPRYLTDGVRGTTTT